jgi:hypothetical protein
MIILASLYFPYLLSFIYVAIVVNAGINAPESHCSFDPPIFNELEEKIRQDGVIAEHVISDAFHDCLVDIEDFVVRDWKESEIIVNEKMTVPDSQGWSICNNCGYTHSDGFLLFHRTSKKPEQQHASFAQSYGVVDMTWSLWGEFFFSNQNDQYSANIVDINNYISVNRRRTSKVYLVKRPVFVLPMITLHVGHVLIDLLEEIYYSMLDRYGRVRVDSLIVLDVAGNDERSILQEKIFQVIILIFFLQ